jgi:hypothetical protein
VVLNTPNLATDIRNLLNMGTHDFQWVPSIFAPDTPTSFESGGTGGSAWRYYFGAGHYIFGPFLAYYDAHGGLQTLGLPRTEQMLEDGRIVQYFQGGVLTFDPSRHAVVPVNIGARLARAVSGSTALRGSHALVRGLAKYYHVLAGGKVLGNPVSGILAAGGTRMQFFENGALVLTPAGPRLLPAGDAVLRLKGWLPAAGAADYYPASFAPQLLSGFSHRTITHSRSRRLHHPRTAHHAS